MPLSPLILMNLFKEDIQNVNIFPPSIHFEFGNMQGEV
jgi:hypothetical protein